MKTKSCPNPGPMAVSLAFITLFTLINLNSVSLESSKPVIYLLISILTLSLQILIFFSDPSLKACSDHSPLLKNPYKKLSNLYSITPIVNSTSIKVPFRFCETCKISTYEDTEHCTQCGVCISGFQNHCVFLSNCIGQSNKILFYLFLGALHCWNLFNLVIICAQFASSYFQALVLLPVALIFEGYLTAISLLKCFL